MAAIQVKHTEAKLLPAQQTKVDFGDIPPRQSPLPDGAATIIPISFLIFWTIAVIAYLVGSKRTREAVRETRLQISRAHQAPCRNCQYFIDNPYLKCAVNPTVAMTRSAIDCKDYQTRTLDGTTRQRLKQ